jgi:amino acid transporter
MLLNKKQFLTIIPAKIKRLIVGKAIDPFQKGARKHIALITFFAWVGLGADGISSSAYGPEEAFIALGSHRYLAIFLAIATGITVFIIAFAYLQVIKLFPNGGGGYRVASTLLGPRAGLVSGSALIVDYVLTIAISVAGGMDALFSILPPSMQASKLPVEFLFVMFLTYLNLRGMKESIKVLMPVFLGFIVTHVFLILYGVIMKSHGLPDLLPVAAQDSQDMAGELGWIAVLALFFKAFSLGGGTYTGLESVSNSLHNLAEPKVKTGTTTMWCIAISLAFMATGIILLYLLWDVNHVAGETLNATVFKKITANWSLAGLDISPFVVGVVLMFEAGILFVAANTGFLAGPPVLSNMSIDRWMPSFFGSLSSRLVTKNAIMIMGVSAIMILSVTAGRVSLLVVLYSINVFLTFTLSFAGICRYRMQNFKKNFEWLVQFSTVLLAMVICGGILITTTLEKFTTGGWITICITGVIVFACVITRKHYTSVGYKIEGVEEHLIEAFDLSGQVTPPKLDHNKPTAVFLVSKVFASGLTSFEYVQEKFPGVFSNFIFVSVGEIDTERLVDDQKWKKSRKDIKTMLKHYVDLCHHKGLPSDFYHAYGTDILAKLSGLTDKIIKDYPHSIFFTSKLFSNNETIFTRILHNPVSYLLQRRLNSKGKVLVIIPIKL